MMTATDELRRLLDELGVEHDDSFGATEFHGEGDSVVVAFNSKSRNAVLYVNAYLTPEQAVEATLGSDLQAENDKLREERDMYRDLVGCMVHPDVPDQLAAENAKLRELVRDLRDHIESDDGFGVDTGWMLDRMCELGVDA